MAAVDLIGISKVFGADVTALESIDLAVADGELVVLLGPSGCGKSTLLRIIAGLERPTEGTVSIGGRVVNDVPGKRRDVAMVFQNYALYPQMTVAENMAFPLRSRKQPKDLIEARVAEVAELLEIDELLGRKPAELSGGQQQRVAMARALVRRPAVLLMDEPLSNLDARLRDQTRKEIRRLQRTAGVTTIYVTHDQTEALTMADRVVVMRLGEIQQAATPNELYQRPSNAFVASFVGSPPRSLVPGTLRDGVLRVGDSVLRLPPPACGAAEPAGPAESASDPGERASEKEVSVAIRPEVASLLDPSSRRSADCLQIEVEVDLSEPLGSETLLEVAPVAAGVHDSSSLIRAKVTGGDAPGVGASLLLSVPAAGIEIFDRRDGRFVWRKDGS